MKRIPPTKIFCYFFAVASLTGFSTCSKEIPDPKFERGTVADIEGNVYKTIIINDKEWMAENLYTTKYRDGSDIVYIGADSHYWLNNNTPAYTWYMAEEKNRDSYGALYNWYTVIHENGLCPDGWRVISRNDWDKMLQYLMKRHKVKNDPIDNPNAVGKMLKSCRQVNNLNDDGCNTAEHPRWDAHEKHYGTDDYEFAALPGGIRTDKGDFYGRGTYGLWWTSNNVHADSAAVVYLNYDYSKAFGNNRHKRNGLSVRCVRNI
jgi:uncharacterized protein (TIGR02145 family)